MTVTDKSDVITEEILSSPIKSVSEDTGKTSESTDIISGPSSPIISVIRDDKEQVRKTKQ